MIELHNSELSTGDAPLQANEERNQLVISSPSVDNQTLQKILEHHANTIPLFQQHHDTIHFESQATIDAKKGRTNLNKAFSTRIRSLQQGMHLWIQSLPNSEQRSALEELVATQFNEIANTTDNTESEKLSDYKTHAEALTTYFTALIQRALKTDEKTAAKLLDKAESYAKIDRGRPDHCTITELSNGQLCVQYEEALHALSESQASEYLSIIRALQESKSPDLPWYVSMDPYERAVFDSLLHSKDWSKDDQSCLQEIMTFFKSIPSKLRTIPGVANKSRHHCFIIDKENNLVSQSSEVRSAFPASRELRSTRQSTQQKITQDNIINVIQDDLRISCVNLAGHFGFSEKELPAFLQHLKQHPEIKIPVTVQSLVTPVNTPLFQGSLDSLHPDRAILEQSKLAVATLKNNIEKATCPIIIDGVDLSQNLLISNSNYPQNTEKIAYEISQPLLAYAIEALTQNRVPEKDRDVVANLYQLLLVCREKPGAVPNIMVSSLEALLTSRLGGLSWGHCVSGKDRKGLQTLHNDALKMVFAAYGTQSNTPSEQIEALISVFNGMVDFRHDGTASPDLKRFADIYTELLVNGSAQTLAAENAPGCFGIKTIDKYLSYSPWMKESFIRHYGQPVQEKFYHDHEKLASLNSVKKLCGDTRQALPELEKNPSLSPRKKSLSLRNSPQTSPRSRGAWFSWFSTKPEVKTKEPPEASAIKSILHEIVSHPCWSTKSKNTAIPNNVMAMNNLILDGTDLQTLIQTIKESVGRGNKNRALTTSILYNIVCKLDTEPHSSVEQLIELRNHLYGITHEHSTEEITAILLLAQTLNHPKMPSSTGLNSLRDALLEGFSKDNPNQMDGHFLSWNKITEIIQEHSEQSNRSRSTLIDSVYNTAKLTAKQAIPVLTLIAKEVSNDAIPTHTLETDEQALHQEKRAGLFK